MKIKYLKSKHFAVTPMHEDEIKALIANESDEEKLKSYTERLNLMRQNPDCQEWFTLWKICMRKERETVVGEFCFKDTQELGRVEIEFTIYPGFRGNGYATEVLKTMTEWTLSQDDVYTVSVKISKDNTAAQKVLEKNKFTVACDCSDGLVFEAKRPRSVWIVVFLCIGISCGMSIGNISGNSIPGICLGAALGIAVGAALDVCERKHRAAVESGTTEEKK